MPQDEPALMLTVSDGYVAVSGHSIRCVHAELNYTLNGIPFAVFNLVPDVDGHGPKTFYDVYTAVVGANLGDTVTADFVISGRNQRFQSELSDDTPRRVWEGVFSGAGVFGAAGGSYCQVWSCHSIAALDDTPAMVPPVHGRGAHDFALSLERLHPVEAYSGAQDLWGDIILPVMSRLYPLASELLGKIQARPLMLSGADQYALVEDVCRHVCFPCGSPSSLWDILIGLAQRYRFFVTCIEGDITLVPGIPTTSRLPAKTLPDGFCSLFQETYKWSRPTVQNALALPAWDASLFDTYARVPQQLPEVEHKTLAIRAPSWVGGAYREVARTKETLGLAGSTPVAGYSLAVPNSASSNQSSRAVDLSGVSEAEAAIRLHEKSTQILHMSFNADFCPGSQLAFTPDQSAWTEIMDVGRATLVGCVKQVSVVLTSATNLTGTWVALSNVRALNEQGKIPWDKHPMYNSRWIRAPILQLAGFSQPEEGD